MILDLQKRLVEVGRIRMGATVNAGQGKTRPARLDNWRLTSRDQQRLEAAAAIYGGTPQPWDRQDGVYVLDTDTDNLRIMLLPGQTLTQFFELWSGGGCVRRCDGREEMISGEPCMCPSEYTERTDLAKDGKACKPTTRLSVLLPDVAGIGCWRLETHGYYAAVELAGTSGLLEAATRGGALLPARLRIDQRSQLKAGKTTRFPVPVIDIDVRPDEMLALANGAGAGEVIQFKSLPPAEGTSVEAGLHAVAALAEPAPARANAAEPIGKAAPPPTGAPIAVGEGEPHADLPPGVAAGPPAASPSSTQHITKAQLAKLWVTIRERGVPEATVRQILQEKTQQQSTRAIHPMQFEDVLKAVETVEIPEPQSLDASGEADQMVVDGTLREVDGG